MSTLEFVLVAHAIIVGLAVAQILRGLAELIRADGVKVSYRLLLMATWTLMLLLQIWWAIWSVGDHEVWTFLEFLLFLLPVGILYIIARLCFPMVLTDADLKNYYLRVGKVIWWLVAAIYVSLALFLSPFVFDAIIPVVFASQIGIAVLAIIAVYVKSPYFHIFVIAAMLAQVFWRGMSQVVGN